MEYRKALAEDFPKILELQNRNLFWNLSPSERTDGFLSTAFTHEQLEGMNRSVGIAVAIEGKKVCGYLCASTADFNRAFPLPSAMLEHAAQLTYLGKALTAYHFFVANPICIDHAYRGKGAYLGLRNKILEFVTGHYDLALTFIADENQRSLNASPQAGWQQVGKFTANSQVFWILVVPIAPST